MKVIIERSSACMGDDVNAPHRREYVLSDEVACIGLYARNINMVYQKYLYFTDINYMNIFSNLSQIGKIAN